MPDGTKPLPELVDWRHQAITWTNANLASVRSSNSHLQRNLEENMFNSLAPGKFELNFRNVIFKQILVIDGWGISCEIAQIWMSLDFTDDRSTLVEVMAWCRQATSHYLSQCWPRFMSPYGITRPQWVNMEVNIVSTDDLAPLRTRASVSRVISKFVCHIYIGPIPEGLFNHLITQQFFYHVMQFFGQSWVNAACLML